MIGDGICQNAKTHQNLFHSPLSHIHTFSMHIGDRFEGGMVLVYGWDMAKKVSTVGLDIEEDIGVSISVGIGVGVDVGVDVGVGGESMS